MENVTSNYDAFRDSRGEMQERVVAEFCGGSASVERGFVTHKMYLNPQSTGGLPFCDNESVVVDRKEDPSTQCNDTELRM